MDDPSAQLVPEAVNLQGPQNELGFGPIQFNERATWKIEVRGRESTAVKRLSGTSEGLDPDQVRWKGESDNVYFFKRREMCDVVLTILGTDIRITDEVRLNRVPLFKGVLVGDFEDPELPNANNPLIPRGEFNSFFDVNGTDEEIASGVYPDVLPSDVVPDLPIPVQGDGYIYLNGKDDAAAPDPFFIGGFNNTALNFGLQDRPLNEIYLNFYAHSNGNRSTNLIVELTGIGGDMFRDEKQVIWSGWRKISVRLSEFVLFESGQLGPNVIFPQQLTQLAFQIHSGGGMPGNEAEICIDYIVFTYGSPFKQEK